MRKIYLFSRDFSCVFLVHFVSNNYFDGVQSAIALNFIHPNFFHASEGVWSRDVVHEYDPVRSSVVGRRQCSEPLLSCCVPYRQLQSLIFYIHHFQFEVHAYCWGHVLELVLRKTKENAALPDAAITDEEYLEQVVERGVTTRAA